VLGKLLGLVRDGYIASKYGASDMTDTFFLVNTTITLMAGLISQAINTCAIPILCEIKEDKDRNKLKYINNLLHMILICISILILCMIIFINPITKILAPGFDEQQYLMMKEFFYIGLPCLIFYGISGVRRAYLQNEGFFIESGLSDLLLNFTYVISLIYMGNEYGFYVLMISALIAAVFQVIFQRIVLTRTDYKYLMYFNPKSTDMRDTVSLVVPVFLSSCISDINKLIDKAISSTLSSGALSALTYSSKINTLFLGVFITAVTTVIFPLLSKAANATDEKRQFKNLICRGIKIVMAIAIPISVVLMSVGELVVAILYQRGSFSYINTQMVNNALFFYAMALPGMSIRLVAIKAFYSLKDTKTPVYNGVICIFVNIILNFILKGIMGYVGLACATAIASNLLAIVLLISLYKKIEGYDLKSIIFDFFKILIISIIMGFVVFIIFDCLLKTYATSFVTRVIAITLLAIIGVFVYILLGIVFRVSIISDMTNSLKKRLQRK